LGSNEEIAKEGREIIDRLYMGTTYRKHPEQLPPTAETTNVITFRQK